MTYYDGIETVVDGYCPITAKQAAEAGLPDGGTRLRARRLPDAPLAAVRQ